MRKQKKAVLRPPFFARANIAMGGKKISEGRYFPCSGLATIRMALTAAGASGATAWAAAPFDVFPDGKQSHHNSYD